MYKDETGHISIFSNKTSVYYNGEIRVEKGKGKWVRIINIIIHYMCIFGLLYTCLNEAKKGDETSKFLRILKRGI